MMMLILMQSRMQLLQDLSKQKETSWLENGLLTPFHRLKGFERRLQQPGPSSRDNLPRDKESSIHIRTEPIVRQILGFSWPSADEFSSCYKCWGFYWSDHWPQKNSKNALEFSQKHIEIAVHRKDYAAMNPAKRFTFVSYSARRYSAKKVLERSNI